MSRRAMMVKSGGGGGPPVAPADAANLLIWLRSDQGTYTDAGTTPATADGDNVFQWNDLSGNNNHAVRQGTHNPPILRTGAINGQNAVEFLASNTRNYVLPNVMSALTSGEVFVVVKADADPSVGTAGQLWVLGNTSPFDSYFPYVDGTVYECFGSTTQKNCGNPTPSLASTYRVYNVYSASADFQNFIDGSSFFSTGTNTVSFPTAPFLGNGVNNSLTYSGRIAEFLFYQHKLSGGDRTTVTTYLGARYGLF